MIGRYHGHERPVDVYEDEVLRQWAVRAIRDRTNEPTRLRILEQARTLRNDNFAVGVEILPTHVVAALTDPSGHIYGRRRRELRNGEVITVVSEIAAVVHDLVETSLGIDVANGRVAIGMQIGGPVDAHAGVVLSWKNYQTETKFAVHPVQWDEPVPLASLVQDETGCRTVVENDAAAYAAYELRFGDASRSGTFAVILVRDGVGGGIVRDGRVLSVPFEIGHLTVCGDGRKCACGKSDCIEAHAGRRAILGKIGELMGRNTVPEDLRAVVESAGDASTILQVFRQGGEAIAHGIATTLTLFGVKQVVIYCGPEMCGINKIKAPVAEFFAGVDSYAQHAFAQYRECEIKHKEWDSTHGAMGAALVALNQLFFVPLAPVEHT